MQQLLAVAEADLYDQWRVATKQYCEVARLAGVIDAVVGPVRIESALLCRRDASNPTHETADVTTTRRRLGRLLITCHAQPMVPSMGLDADA